MKFEIRKALLAGTALAAAATFSPRAHAADQTLTQSGTWAGAGTNGGTDAGDASDATMGQSVDIGAYTLTVTDDGVANDGGTPNTFSVGDVSGTDGTLSIISDATGSGTGANLIAHAGNVALSGAGTVSVSNGDEDDETVVAGITSISTGGNVSVVNNETATGDDVTLNVSGALTAGGTTLVKAAAASGADAGIYVTGAADFTGAVTVTGTADAAATLYVAGASANFGGGVNFSTADTSILTFDKNAAQAATGAIGSGTGTGRLEIKNSSTGGASFAGAVSVKDIVIDNGSSNSTAQFGNDVTAASITLGGTAGGTNTLIVDTTNGSATTTIKGAVTGSAGDTNNIVARGGKAVVFTDAVSGDIGNISVSGAGTGLSTEANVTADSVSVGGGATYAVNGGTLTSDVTLTGDAALNFSNSSMAGNIDGAAAGEGTVGISQVVTLDGSIGATGKLSALTIADNGALHVSGSLKAGTTTMTGASAFYMGTGTHAIETGFAAANDGDGTLNFSSATIVTIDGTVGAEGKDLNMLIASNGAEALTLNGDLYAKGIWLGSAGSFTFNGDSGQFVSGQWDKGKIYIGDGTHAPTVTFAKALQNITSLDIAAGARASFLDNADVDGDLANGGGAFEIAAGKTLGVGGAYNTTGGEIVFGYNRSGGATEVGKFAIGGGAADLSLNTVKFLVANGSDTPVAETISDVVTGTGTAAAPLSVSDNSFLYDFKLVANGGNFDLKIAEANVVDPESGNGNYASTADVLLRDLSGVSDPTINAIQTNIVNAGSEKEIEKLVESTQPSVSGGEMAGAMTFSDLSLGVSGERLAALRTGADSGIATGDIARGLHMWAQGFGARADQDARNGVAGYDADTWGAAVGVDSDSALGGNAVIGLAFSYGNTDVDNDDAANSESSVDSYQLTLYGNADLGNAFYLNAQAAYAWNSIETDRYNVGGTGAHAHGDYDASTYSARAEIGHDISYRHAIITPHATADWTHFDPDSYTETGAGGASLHVAGDSLDIIEAGFGINASRAYRTSGGSYIEPKLHADYRYNFGDDQVATSTSFAAGGPAFRTEGAEAAPNRFTVGASLRYLSVNNWDLTASYDYDFRSDYGSHEAMLRAGYKF